MREQVEIDRRHTSYIAAVQFTFISIDYLAIRKYDKCVNSLEKAKVRWAKVTESEVSKYLVIGIQNIYTHIYRESERHTFSPSVSLFSLLSFFSFFFILSLNQHLILLLLLLLFLTHSLHSFVQTYTHIHTPFIIEMYLY